MSIWGAVLALQVLRNVPNLWILLRRRPAEALPPPAPTALPGAGHRALPAPVGVPSAIAQEGARVRALLEARGGSDADRLIAEVDRILKLTGELGARLQDMEEQTTDSERASLQQAVAAARERLQRADTDQDRRLFERQLEVLQGREEAIAKALRVLERLRVRRELAEHQLKQLRLDLSRGAAGDLDVPELSSRLEFIRYEIDAREEVEEIGAGARAAEKP
jgi:hypothetical protein